jgi:hypothetical protein
MRGRPAIVGFAIGCGPRATNEVAIGLRLYLQTLALLAVAMGTNLEGGRDS